MFSLWQETFVWNNASLCFSTDLFAGGLPNQLEQQCVSQSLCIYIWKNIHGLTLKEVSQFKNIVNEWTSTHIQRFAEHFEAQKLLTPANVQRDVYMCMHRYACTSTLHILKKTRTHLDISAFVHIAILYNIKHYIWRYVHKCMCIYKCERYACIFTRTYIIYIYIYMCENSFLHMHSNTQICIHTPIQSIHTHIHIPVHIHLHLHEHIYACVHTCKTSSKWKYTYTYRYIEMYAYTCMFTYVRIEIYTCIKKYVHVQIHIIYIRM